MLAAGVPGWLDAGAALRLQLRLHAVAQSYLVSGFILGSGTAQQSAGRGVVLARAAAGATAAAAAVCCKLPPLRH